MEFKVKPTFGTSAPIQEVVKDSTIELEQKLVSGFRPEMGAVWKRQSKNNTEYMNIKLELTKEKLQSLLLKEGETIQVNLVAFPNKTHNGNVSRPNFRIYEELTKETR